MKNNSKLIVIILLIIFGIILSIVFLSFSENNKSEPSDFTEVSNLEADYVASFAIYTNGTFRVFTSSMYHKQSPEVFIDSGSPNTILVKKSNLTWRDFFNTLPFELNENCLTTGIGETFCTNETFALQFFINGEPAPDALNQIIRSDDKLLVTFDRPDSEAINEQLSSFSEN